MNDFDNLPRSSEPDADGRLFDPRVRSAMTLFAPGEDIAGLEAAAAVRAASHAVDSLRGRGAGGRGLSTGALDLLIRLHSASDGGVSMGDLALSVGVTARNVTGLVDTLERDELVRRISSRTDRRSVLVEVTPVGRAWVDAFRRPTQAAMAAMFDGFTPAELTELRHLCLRLVENQRRIDRAVAQPDLERTEAEGLIP
jgi:DNA-binding MarR family transcriptional regulator